MKRVAGRVRADEALAAAHIIEQRLLADQAHRRLQVRPWRTKIARGVEEDAIKLREVLGTELRTVFREREFPAMTIGQILQDLLRVTWLAIFPRDDRVLEAAGLGE